MTGRDDSPDLFAATQAAPHVPRERGGNADPHTLGARLRAARQEKGLAIAQCASTMHLPIQVLQRLEANEFGSSEDFVYLRGSLTGYARFLGLPPGSCDATLRALAPATQPALVSVARTSAAKWLLQRYGTAATYIVLTATIAVPLVLLGLRGGLERPSAHIVSLDQAPSATESTAQEGAAANPAPLQALSSASPDATPFRASMTPFVAIGLADGGEPSTAAPVASGPAAAVPAAGHTLTLAASANCWFDIADADGEKVASGMLRAGDSRTWHSAGPLHVTLGNVAGVTVTGDGRPVALAAYRHANVARFDVFGPAADGGANN